MRVPVIVVTGGIGSGKTTVAKMIAGRRGALVDCDSLGHRVLEDRGVKRRLVRAFGGTILTPSGRVSRVRLARIVFSDERDMNRLNAAIRPRLTKTIADEVRRLGEGAEYIVLDAVLFFQYTFEFKVDCVVRTEASREARLTRIMQRDGFSRDEALRRIERQKELEGGWARADLSIDTDRPLGAVARDARRIRDGVMRNECSGRRNER